jgi:hypothetical protein
MKTYTVGDLKTNFSQILEWVRAGEEIAIARDFRDLVMDKASSYLSYPPK